MLQLKLLKIDFWGAIWEFRVVGTPQIMSK